MHDDRDIAEEYDDDCAIYNYGNDDHDDDHYDDDCDDSDMSMMP